MKRLNPLNHALLGAAAAAFVAAPASAELNFFWTYSESGGDVTNTLNLTSSFPGFTASIFADPDGAATFNNADASLLPSLTAGESFLNGGTANPIVIGTAPELGGAPIIVIDNGPDLPDTIIHPPASIGSVVDATWISDFPGNVFPTGTTAAPIAAGQFTIAAGTGPLGTTGDYTIRISNAGDILNEVPLEVVQFSGTITNGRFAQRLPGDANIDGAVDAADLVILDTNFGQSGGVLDGDFNGDGLINAADLVILDTNFGTSTPAASSLVAVPEPSSLALLGLGGLAFLRRRRYS